MVRILWPALLLLLLFVSAIQAQEEYSIAVYPGFHYIQSSTSPVALHEDKFIIGNDYTLEIKSTRHHIEDYLLRSCIVEETGEEIIQPAGCLKCTNVFINMVETSGYMLPNAISKQSLIHFRSDREVMTFRCTLDIHTKGCTERACEKGLFYSKALLVPIAAPYILTWSNGGFLLPWWGWILLALLLALLLCCCLGACIFAITALMRKKKQQAAVGATYPKEVIQSSSYNSATAVDYKPKPTCVVGATQTSNFDSASERRLQLDAASLESHTEVARLAATSPEKVEVFSGHAGVYNVRNGRYEKNDQRSQTRLGHYGDRFEDRDRHSYFNQGFETEGREVECVEGFDEVIRYHTDRELGEYEHVEREFEESHTRRFTEEPATTSTPRYYDRRHRSIPV